VELFHDFHYLYAASRVLLEGGSPYDRALLSAALQEIGWGHDQSIPGFPYPPWTWWIFVPFGLVGFGVASLLWTFFASAVLGICVTAFRRSLIESGYPLSPTAAMLAATLFFPTFKLLIFGQLAFVPLLGIVAWWCLRHNRAALAGGMLSLCIVKPHLTALFVGVLLVRATLNRRWPILIGFATGSAAQISTAALFPAGLNGYLTHVAQFYSDLPSLLQPTVWSLATSLFPNATDAPSILAVLNGGGLLLALAIFARNGRPPPLKNELESLFTRLLPLSVILSPYAWSHDFILFLPALLLYAPRLEQIFGETGFFLMLLLQFSLGLITILNYKLEVFCILYPLLFVVTGFCFGKKPNRLVS